MESVCAALGFGMMVYCVAVIGILVFIWKSFTTWRADKGRQAELSAEQAAAERREEAELRKQNPEAWLKFKEMEHERGRMKQERARLDHEASKANKGILGTILGVIFQVVLKKKLE